MARTGRPKAELVLSDDERAALEGWRRRPSTPQAWALRCQIILACASGASNKDVAAAVGATPQAVGRWRARFIEYRIAGLGDMPRTGGPRRVSDEQVFDIVTRTLKRRPTDGARWSTRSMAKELGLSQSTVSRIWRTYGLNPHRSVSLSTHPHFISKVHDVVGLYLDPPERALAFCADEKSQPQAPDRSQPASPTTPGVPKRQTADHVQPGMTTLFAALEVAAGKVIAPRHHHHRPKEFEAFLARLDRDVPTDLDVHLVCDDYTTHKAAAIKKWLSTHPRFHLHFVPTRSSWLILVERWFAELASKQIDDVHDSIHALEPGIRNWLATWNSQPRPYAWTRERRHEP